MTTRSIAPLALAAAFAVPLCARADPLSIFQPTQVRAVSVTPADERSLRALPPLDAFGTLRGTRSPGVDEAASAAEAGQAAGFALRLPPKLPASLAHGVRYEITERARTSFTFDRAKAAAWARAHKVTLHAMPPGLNGSTYTATLRPVAIVTYGTPPSGRHGDRGARRRAFLSVVQAPVPTVTSSGAPLRVLADWFAQQPGISPHLAAEVRAIGDPAQTLPIPIRFDRQTATRIDVDGVSGLAIGDETGIGSAIVWTKHGTLYVVGGTLRQSEVLALANALR